MSDYAELQIATNFSFLRGASHPDELAGAAARLGLRALAITDRNSLAGIVRAHGAARRAGVRLVIGARLDLADGPSLLCYPGDRAAYGRLARLLTVGKRRAAKGECLLTLADLFAHGDGQIVAALPPVAPVAPAAPDDAFATALRRLARHFPESCYLAAHYLYRGDDGRRIQRLADLAAACRVALLATNDVHAHTAERRPLQDVLTCIREHCTITEAGYRLFANAERHLKSGAEMARLFAPWPGALRSTLEIAERAAFSLDELRYEYPDDPVPDGRTPQAELEHLSRQGARQRFPDGVPDKVAATIHHELRLIGELNYAPYFLTVHDIVKFARSRGILCQGRGSAANSAVCYVLGITAVDPTRIDLLFERFISAERGEPPDIDVDFEHERREEVIQYIYEKYGRDRAGIAATVVSYRSKSAIREVGKAMGLSLDATGALAGMVWGRSGAGVDDEQVREAGLDPADPNLRLTLKITRKLIGFPRHLSQHVGGFVITRGALCEVVPIANAAMAERTFIEWDKDDLDALGILKIDILGLGMLTCIRKCFQLIESHHGRALELATVPAGDEATYDMLCAADSVGVFQVESRAQMNMLPRLKPRCFYDLVIEVAIVRPGPIQGDMVHPYLRRRSGGERVEYPAPDPAHGPGDELKQVLGKTLGVPLFQEQAMRIAIVAAGFEPAEADQLRRAMATFRRMGTIKSFEDKMVGGMTARGYDRDFASRCFKQIEGFGEYGFPESHAASFALLVYVSAWLKRHYPHAFACALLNSQPMGFYAPAQIVRCAREHGVMVRPPDINRGGWDAVLEPVGRGEVALRLGLRQIKGLAKDDADAVAALRGGGYDSVEDLARRSGLAAGALETLAAADAFRSLGLDRRAAEWAVRALDEAPLPLFAAAREGGADVFAGDVSEPECVLPPMALGEHVVHDYAALRLSLKEHPMALLRRHLADLRAIPNARLVSAGNDCRVTVAGLVTVRQRPGTAKGVIFMTIEDETGIANIIVWPRAFERYRKTVLSARLIAVTGKVQRDGIVIHVIADHLVELNDRLALLTDDAGAVFARRGRGRGRPSGPRGGKSRLVTQSRDFH